MNSVSNFRFVVCYSWISFGNYDDTSIVEWNNISKAFRNSINSMVGSMIQGFLY
jgi:hypothetical protein